MLNNISSQPISEDIFKKLVYPEGGVLVLVLAFLTLVVLLMGNVILGCVHKPFLVSILFFSKIKIMSVEDP